MGLEKVYEASADERGRASAARPARRRPADQPAPADAAGRSPSRTGSGCGRSWSGPSAVDDLEEPRRARPDRHRRTRQGPGRSGAPSSSSGPIPPAKAPWESSTGSPRCDSIWASPRRRGRSGKARPRSPARRSATPGSGGRLWPRASSTRPGRAFEQALAADPDLFEARYGLAVLEQDAGRASAAYEHALRRDRVGPDRRRPSAARAMASGVSRFARKEASGAVSWNGPLPSDDRSETGDSP